MFKNILIPVDVSGVLETQRLLGAAYSLSQSWGSKLHVVTVIPDVGMPIVGSYMNPKFEVESKKEVEDALRQAVAASKIEAEQYVLSGSVYDKVIELADVVAADLIVIGAHKPGLGDYLLGSNAARVVRHSGQSVLVIRD